MTETTLECRDAPEADDAAGRVLRRVGAWFVAFAAWRERRRLMAALDRLGGRTLADIGIERTQFGQHLRRDSIAAGQFTVASDGRLGRPEREAC